MTTPRRNDEYENVTPGSLQGRARSHIVTLHVRTCNSYCFAVLIYRGRGPLLQGGTAPSSLREFTPGGGSSFTPLGVKTRAVAFQGLFSCKEKGPSVVIPRGCRGKLSPTKRGAAPHLHTMLLSYSRVIWALWLESQGPNNVASVANVVSNRACTTGPMALLLESKGHGPSNAGPPGPFSYGAQPHNT